MSLAKIIVSSLLGLSLLGCEDQTNEQECCQCLDDNKCTIYTEERCLDVFQILYGEDKISVNGDCVRENRCYLPCSLAGSYFDKNKMIFKK